MARVVRPMKPDYFPVFPLHLLMDEDYEHLTREEWGSVFLLMQHQWIKEGTLPEDHEKLAAIARCSLEQLDALRARWPKLMPVEDHPGRVAIAWLWKEYNRAIGAWEGFREKQVDAGRRSAEARTAKYGTAQPKTTNDGSNDGSKVVVTMVGTTHEPPSHPIPSHPNKETPPVVPAEADHTPVVLSMPCVAGKTWPLTEGRLAKWRETFPHLDVMQEARKMLLYLEDNPAKRKTFGGMGKFTGGWLGRAQDSGGSRASPWRGSSSSPPQGAIAADVTTMAKVQQIHIPKLARVGGS